MNYNMNGLDKTTDELFAMLKTVEASMQKDPSHVLAMMNTTSSRRAKAEMPRAVVRPKLR